MNDIASIYRVYQGSDGEATKALYERLERLAVNLFRACKSSARAKVYRGGRYRGAAYDRKQWAMDNLAAMLGKTARPLGIVWGWGVDDKQPYHRHVLYVDIPTGQVSFHCAVRDDGPDYPGQWDGQRGQAADRICRWIARLLAAAEAELS